MKYFLLIVEGDVEPIAKGPYESDEARDRAAINEKRERGDQDGIYWLNVSERGLPFTGSYSGKFFEVNL